MKKDITTLLSVVGAITLVFIIGISTAIASPILYVNDSAGRLGTVDVYNGSVNVIGNMGVVMTDIAFDPNGNLFGLSFTHLYNIDSNTATVSQIGAHGIRSGNSLVFGTDGTLYAGGDLTTHLFEINTNTGVSTDIGNMGFYSAGDLAFNHGDLFLSSKNNQLVNIDLANGSSGTAVCPSGFSNVYGMATGDDEILYGVSGTSIFSIDMSTGAGTLGPNYKNHGLGTAYGSSFVKEAVVPIPGAAWLLGSGLICLVGLRKNLRKSNNI
ncbi:MAG: hypothetical protein U9N19_09330 [Thermodesulfobacteriota bacterium]|nr:hypothetical protein [Thermodesulfobacteriota bacterium]